VAPTSLEKGRGSHWLRGSRWGGDVGGDTDGQHQVTWQLWGVEMGLVVVIVIVMWHHVGLMWAVAMARLRFGPNVGNRRGARWQQWWSRAGELDGNSGGRALVVVVAVNVVGLRREATI